MARGVSPYQYPLTANSWEKGSTGRERYDDTDDFNASSVSVVSRRSRLSCEAHPSLVFDDGLVGEDANIDDNMDEEENMLLRALMGED